MSPFQDGRTPFPQLLGCGVASSLLSPLWGLPAAKGRKPSPSDWPPKGRSQPALLGWDSRRAPPRSIIASCWDPLRSPRCRPHGQTPFCPVLSPSSPSELVPTGLPTKHPQVSVYCAAPHPHSPQGEDERDLISLHLQRGLSLLPFHMAAPWQILKQECSPIKCTLSV